MKLTTGDMARMLTPSTTIEGRRTPSGLVAFRRPAATDMSSHWSQPTGTQPPMNHLNGIK